MAIITLSDMLAQLALTADAPPEDLALVSAKAEAAQNHIERLLGFKIEETFGGDDQEAVPPALQEAVLQLAAHWYENREASGDASGPILFSVEEIVREFRGFTF